MPLWLIAAGLAVSWVADSIAFYTFTPLGGPLWWPFLQFALVLAALTGGWLRAAWIVTMWALAVLCAVLLPPPHLLYRVAGSLAILLMASKRLAPTLALYFGIGTTALVLAVLLAPVPTLAVPHPINMPAWYAYQGCRVVAFGAFVGVVLMHRTGGRRGILDRNPAGADRRRGPADPVEPVARPAGRHA